VRWTADGWQTFKEIETRDSGLGLHVAELDTVRLAGGGQIELTFQRTATGEWAGRNFTIAVTRG
jgi:glucoamylase